MKQPRFKTGEKLLVHKLSMSSGKIEQNEVEILDSKYEDNDWHYKIPIISYGKKITIWQKESDFIDASS